MYLSFKNLMEDLQTQELQLLCLKFSKCIHSRWHFSLQNSLVDQGMSNEETNNIIEKVTKLSGELHHSVMMAKQFLKEVP